MLIDWFTVVAQIVNFIVLVALLKRFLYGPLIEAIDTRESGIAARLAEAAEKNREAAAQVADAQKQLAEVEAERARILAEAKAEAERVRGDLVERARDSVKAMEVKWTGEMERDRAVFLDAIRSRAATEVLEISRRALAGLASTELECGAIQAFVDQVRKLDPAGLEAICAGEVTVATPEALPEETRSRIREAIECRAGCAVAVSFETAPSMSWGIELRGGGRRIGWTPESYVDGLEEKLKDALARAA